MKKLVFAFLISTFSSVGFAAPYLTHWEEAMRINKFLDMPGNYKCVPRHCDEAVPALETVNCKNLEDITFTYNRRDLNDVTTGYVWFGYAPDGPTGGDFLLARDFTIEGLFDDGGFKSTGVFKNPEMGSTQTVDLKSLNIKMLPPAGKYARATVDFGGQSPLEIDLQCCRPGTECAELNELGTLREVRSSLSEGG